MKKRHRTIGGAALSEATQARRSAEPGFPVIAVGASAGGLEAFSKLLHTFPSMPGIAVIFVQHLDPTHESMMVSLLAPHARMQVREAADGMRVEPNNVYVIAPGTYLAIRHGTLWVSEPKDRHGARLPVDFLFRSMAEACGERAIAVVLSGNGADGSLGAKTINERGGLVIAQEPEEAAYAGMPKSAIGTGIVDLVMPIQKMAASIASYTRQMDLLPRQSVSDDTEGASADLRLIIDLLRSVATADYSSYKPGTLMRRIRRRMAIRAVGEVRAYLEVLRADAKEVDILARDLLIHVTGFFRDKDVFDLLATKIIPDLVRDHPAGQTLRVWVPACSSGEEVYSLAMLFLEEIAAKNKGLKLQIFGSDIDEHAVAMARAGRYPASLRSEVSPERLARFFAEDADGYRVMPSLREMVIFTVQDVLTDPPFAQLDFISCRNLLIYLLPEAQHRVLSLLHFALRKDGILMLGIAESVSALNGDFDPVSEGLRVFRRIGGIRRLKPQVYARDRVRGFWPRPPPASTPEVSPGEIARNLLIAAFAPASVLIDHRHHSLFYFGPTDSYLKISAGDAAHDLFAMVRPGLRNKLRAAVQRARREETLVSIAGGAVEKDGESRPVLIEVRPVASGDKPLFLVSFIASNKSPTGGTPEVAAADAEPGKIALLEKVIETLRQELEETGRQLETVSADHEAINEEAQSLNEEYQSTNEELETSKEELQSVNEELTALNAQLTATVQQQRTTADDLDNILRSSEVAIVFLDLGLNIRFFSAAAKTLLNIIDTDIGRPIGDLAHHFDHSDLVVDARGVLRTAVASRREIRSHGGDWFSRQILPYRSATGAVQGVVLIFSNISLAKAAELKIETARTYADKVIDTVRQPLAVIDERLRLISVNSAFCTAFRTQPKDLIGRGLTAFGDGRLDLPAMNNFLDRARAEVAPIEDYELACDLPGLGPRILLLSSRKIPDGDNAGQRILVAIEDITDRKQITDALEIAKSKAEKANLGKSRFLAAASHDLRQPLQTLSLLHGVLARKITDHESLGLIGKLAETLGAMSGMLDTLLDINQLEAGTVQPEIDTFAIATVLEHLKTEFAYLAKSKGLTLHVVDSTLRVRSDPLLLSQMVRNLLSNAVKYTKRGKILLGCRRVGKTVRLEVWDTGIGIPSGQLKLIFEEYHQLGNPARERGLGLGLGLSIVERIGDLLGHKIDVRSSAGQGSVFIVEVPLGDQKGKAKAENAAAEPSDDSRTRIRKDPDRSGTLLIVEDDPAVREALQLLFKSEGYHTVVATDGIEVAALLQRGALMPDVIIADYNLPGGRNGLQVIGELRQALSREIPAIVLTGDIATDVLRRVAAAGCDYLHKPVNVDQLTRRVADLLATAQGLRLTQPEDKPDRRPKAQAPPIVYVVDDDEVLLGSLRDMLQNKGIAVETHASAQSFLTAYRRGSKGCLVIDSVMPGMSGLELLLRLKAEDRSLPSIVITGYGDVPMAIKAMKAGAMDFIEKPAREEVLLASIDRALMQSDNANRTPAQIAAAASIAALTPRERDVMELVVQGLANKEIAANLKISQRTVEAHRAEVMKSTGSASLPDLIRLVMRAS